MFLRAELVRIVDELDGHLPFVRGLAGPRVSLDDGALVVWDDALAIERTVTTSLPPSATLLDVAPDLSAIAAAVDGKLLIAQGDLAAPPVRVEIPADGAAFLPTGRLLVTAPSEWPEGRGFSESHRVLLLDAAGGVVAETPVEADAATPHLLRHPSEPAVVCDFAMGQDGNVLTTIRDADRRLELVEIFRAEDFVDLSFSPQGDRLLLGPYPSDPERAVVVTWPSLEIEASLDAADLGLDIGFDVSGGHLSEDRVLLLATEQGLVVADGDLADAALVEMIDFDGYVGEEGFVESLAPLTADSFAAVLWDEGKRTTTVWRLQP